MALVVTALTFFLRAKTLGADSQIETETSKS